VRRGSEESLRRSNDRIEVCQLLIGTKQIMRSGGQSVPQSVDTFKLSKLLSIYQTGKPGTIMSSYSAVAYE